jgi:hypothetical protein
MTAGRNFKAFLSFSGDLCFEINKKLDHLKKVLFCKNYTDFDVEGT